MPMTRRQCLTLGVTQTWSAKKLTYRALVRQDFKLRQYRKKRGTEYKCGRGRRGC